MKIVSFKEKELLKKALDNDEVIAFPTETVFGLGARSSSEKAYENLVKVKNRRPDKPFTLMCGSISQIVDYIEINENTEKLIKKFMPGSITLLVKPKENIKHYLHLNSPYIGFRIPNNEDLQSFLNYYGEPLLVPSANKSDEIPALSHEEVKKYFENEIEYCVEGYCKTNEPSTIVIVNENDFKIVRNGPISENEIKEALK